MSLSVFGRGHWIYSVPLIRLCGSESVNWANKMTGPPAFTLEKSEKPTSMRRINLMGSTRSQSGNPVTGRFNHVLQLYTAVFDFVCIDHKGELAKHRRTDFQADGAQQVNSTVILYILFFFFPYWYYSCIQFLSMHLCFQRMGSQPYWRVGTRRRSFDYDPIILLVSLHQSFIVCVWHDGIKLARPPLLSFFFY